MPEVKDVRVGLPEQGTTGAILSAPLGTTIPDLSDITQDGITYNSAFTGNEYVSEDGLTLTPTMNTTDIKDWSGATVRKLVSSFDGTLGWSMISTNANQMKLTFGEEYVTTEAATTTHGNQVKAALGAHLPDPRAWLFLMKDGDARMVIAVPNGQITELGEVTFNSTNAVGWGVTLSTYPDENGHNAYILTDDGQVIPVDSES